ncbi:hypothetical protein EDB80DRAFT_676313 [Ilyonectria destructans]|nr:hypothetical protein EDB80DRAFT_676313 [Ilyonectria destructans]
MCYQVVTHTMVCDVRPVVFNGEEQFVDTFTVSPECACKPDPRIKSWFRCEEHGCCRVLKKKIQCPTFRTCTGDIELHRYEQPSSQQKSQAWDSIGNLDEVLFPYGGMPYFCEMTTARQRSLVEVIGLIRQITEISDMLEEARSLLELLRKTEKMVDEWKRLLKFTVSLYQASFWLLQFHWEKPDDLSKKLDLFVKKDTKEVLDKVEKVGYRGFFKKVFHRWF